MFCATEETLLFDDEDVLDLNQQTNMNTEISYQILLNLYSNELSTIRPEQQRIIQFKNLKKFITELDQTFSLTLCNRSQIVKELFYLHQLAKTLDRYNTQNLNFSYPQFRSLLYFPNIVVCMTRLLPNAKKFIHNMLKKVYQEFVNKAGGLVNVHVNSFYIDQDQIRADILSDFIGNALKKYDPLEIGNIKAFYRSCFRSIFQFYFKRKRDLENQDLVSFSFYDSGVNSYTKSSSRYAIFRDVLYEIHIKETQKKHSVLSQLSYNFQLFKNIILPNEFQNIYQNTKSDEEYFSNNKEYQLIDFFDDDLFENNPDLLEKVKKLPLIYKLLRCVHIQSQNTMPYNELLIRPENVKFVIIEELSAPFKNIFLEDYVKEILEQIAKNFIKNILSGEYINLITFSTVKINHISFLDQLRKFIRICLDQQN